MDLGSMWGPSEPPCRGLVAIFLGNVCAFEFLFSFYWIFGASRGPRRSNPSPEEPIPPFRLVTFGMKTQDFVRERLHFQDVQGSCSAEATDFQSAFSRVCQIL